jgi:cystathionine beta-lyase family protein involved in aluminum resistance
MAPSIVGESMKGADLLANVMGKYFGYPCNPAPGSHRTDIIQAIKFKDRSKVRNKTQLHHTANSVVMLSYS